VDKYSAMKSAGIVNREAINAGLHAAQTDSLTTFQLSKIVGNYIRSCGMEPAFLGYMGFPGECCICVDEDIVHGVPSDKHIPHGSILTIDCGVKYYGINVDAADTIVTKLSKNPETIYVTTGKELFNKYISLIKCNMSLYDIAALGDEIFRSKGYKIYNNLSGHGIGEAVHIPPTIFHTLYGLSDGIINNMKMQKLTEGQAICIEPILTNGTHVTQKLSLDGWTLRTTDGAKPIHFENTLYIHKNHTEIIS